MEEHSLCNEAIQKLHRSKTSLHFTLQNATEFWNVATRPLARNGHGLSIGEAATAWNFVHESVTLLPDDERVYKVWRALVQTHQVRGVQVHDARLAAAMLVHNVTHILTLNTGDFARFPGLIAVRPQEV